MLPTLFATAVVVFTLSLDDFIITQVTSNTSTIGLRLYQSAFKT
jgi:spermidine/putrescine transport system permease protein